jgi:hypothetical protein
MSISVMNDCWKYSKSSGTPLLVLLCLADFADDEGECWPSISTIGKKCRLKDDRHVQRVIRGLEKLGEVLVIRGQGRSSSKGGVRSNRYRIIVHMPDEAVTPADRPPSEANDPGPQTTHDGGPSTTHDPGPQTTQTPADRPPEPSLTHQADSSVRFVDDENVGGSLTRAANGSSPHSQDQDAESELTDAQIAENRRRAIAVTAKLGKRLHANEVFLAGTGWVPRR